MPPRCSRGCCGHPCTLEADAGRPSPAALQAARIALGRIPDPAPAWREILVALERGIAEFGPAVPERKNALKKIARRAAGRRLYVYSSSGPMAAVALRWRHQLNENAKRHVFQATTPELCHNEIVGWQAAPAVLGRSLVFALRDGDDHPREKQRLDHLERLVDRCGVPVVGFLNAGLHPLTRMAGAVQTGDLLSVYMALVQGVNPTDIRAIDELKHWLAGQPPA